METKYLIMLLVIPIIPLFQPLLGMKQPTMQVVQSTPPIRIAILAVPVEQEGISATANNEQEPGENADLKTEVATGAAQDTLETDWEYIEKESAELKKKAMAVIDKKAQDIKNEVKAAIDNDAQENDSDWYVVTPADVRDEMVKLRQALEEHTVVMAEQDKGHLARLYDMLIGAAALTAFEIAYVLWSYSDEIRFIIEYRNEFSAIWTALRRIIG